MVSEWHKEITLRLRLVPVDRRPSLIIFPSFLPFHDHIKSVLVTASYEDQVYRISPPFVKMPFIATILAMSLFFFLLYLFCLPVQES